MTMPNLPEDIDFSILSDGFDKMTVPVEATKPISMQTGSGHQGAQPIPLGGQNWSLPSPPTATEKAQDGRCFLVTEDTLATMDEALRASSKLVGEMVPIELLTRLKHLFQEYDKHCDPASDNFSLSVISAKKIMDLARQICGAEK